MKSLKQHLTHNENRYCFNESKGAYNQDRYFSSILNEQIYVDEVIYSEKLVDESVEMLPAEYKGGIITFSTVMNSTQLSNNKIINFLKQKLVTIVNSVSSMKKIDKVASKFDLQGWTVTKGLHGKYIDRKTGTIFDEKSISIELVGITQDVLLDVAENLCNEFKQQCVLVKSYENNDIWFVNGKY